MWKLLPLWTRAGLLALGGALLLLLIVTQVAARTGFALAQPVVDPPLVIHMAGLRFTPDHVGVSAGTQVVWLNDDTTFHAVMADDGSWGSLVLGPGERYTRTFDLPGFFPYHCEFLPDMHGRLSVGPQQRLPLVLRDAVLNPTPTMTPTATSTPGPTSAVIGPLGGTLDAPDGSAHIDVPPNAVEHKVLFSYAPATPDPPPDAEDAGNAFDLSAAAQGTPVTQFGQPISLTLRYKDPAGDLPGLGLFVQSADGSWEERESVIDAGANTVTSATDHLSRFALFRRILPAIYWKAGGWRDYAPSGMPDFDQRQDAWRNSTGQWTFCGPVAAANSLWWFDSKFEPNPVPPPVLNDGYPLLSSYSPGVWDDHDPRNVQPFVGNLAALAGIGPAGTQPTQLAQGIKTYLVSKGLDDAYTVTLQPKPEFGWVEAEVERSEDVILLIGFWQESAAGWRRIGGHYVTAAGVDSPRRLIAFSDPFANAAEVGGWGRVLPPGHPAGHAPGLHNDARFVSHDLYRVIDTHSPGGTWGPWGYARWLVLTNFQSLNTPDEFLAFQGTYNRQLPVWAEVEYAIAVSPVPSVLTPTPTATRSTTPTPTPTRTATHSPTPTPSSTSTSTRPPTHTPTPTATPEFYWKAGGWIDYAPSGVPDFDQRQDAWGVGGGPGAADWKWTFCGPVAVANSVWWFDSKFEPNPVAPPAINDGYNLVASYAPGQVDDHDPLNVDNPATVPGPNGELVEDLAWRMDTDGRRTGSARQGTNVMVMHQAIQTYLTNRGLGSAYSVTLVKAPALDWVVKEVLRSEDVILLLGFWELRADGMWERVGGHYVTVVGIAPDGAQIAFSDPYRDNAEVGGPGRVLPGPHLLPHPATLHNDAAFVSHDIWRTVATDSPGGSWGPAGYAQDPTWWQNFAYQNVPDEFGQVTGAWLGGPVQVEVEYAIAVSPVEPGTVTPTATPTATRLPTATPTPTPTATWTKHPTITATATATRVTPEPPPDTVTPTPTRTLTPTRTATPTPTATRKPLLTGVRSTFRETAPGVIEITVHVNKEDLDGKIYDLEILYNEQDPKWGDALPLEWPQGWVPMPVPGGVGWQTPDTPLRYCQEVIFIVKVEPPQVGDVIPIHLTDKDHNNLGYVDSQRVP